MNLKKIVFKDSNSGSEVSYGGGFIDPIRVPQFNGKMRLNYVMDSESIEDEGDCSAIYNILFNRANESSAFALDADRLPFPSFEYSDVTEKLLLSEQEIKEGNLKSKDNGILAYSGKRILKLSILGNLFYQELVAAPSVKIIISDVNGESFDIDCPSSKCSLKSEITKDGVTQYTVVFALDTDKLGEIFAAGKFVNKEHVTVGCFIEISIDDAETMTVRFPLRFVLNNTNPDICKMISPKAASVDFGTSSTCVAIWQEQGGPKLLTLSPCNTEEPVNPYENPTNMMMFNWDSVSKEWLDSEAFPIFRKGNRRDFNKWSQDKSNRAVNYDFGYSVKDELGDPKDTKVLNSILSLIKLFPSQILEKQRQYEIIPFGNEKQFVDIVCDPDKQDEKHFDPVAFYGYLIGRAINDFSKHSSIHTRFQVSYPVKFSERVKDCIRESLLWGMKRSVPKPLESLVKVEMKYSEPVAYIGALCGTKYFKIEDGASEPFAVFDFGGGTLDFSFGIASNEDGELDIHVKMIGGKGNIGGESLIERLSYAVYCRNINAMIEKNIPIEKPDEEIQPDELTDDLIKSSCYTRSNMNAISARISRKFFEGRDMEGAQNEILSLYDKDGVQHDDVEVSYDVDELDEILHNAICDAVKAFSTEMDVAFDGEPTYDRSKVHIFLAGNSSKNKHVQPLMKKMFLGNDLIELVDQIESGDASEKRYAITPKTAVAIGQLNLNNCSVHTDLESFKLHVGFFNMGTSEFKEILGKGASDKEWRKFKKIRNECVDVFYGDSLPQCGSMNNTEKRTLSFPGCDDKYLFIRMKDQFSIEYCVGENLETLSENVQEIDLK